MLRLILATTWLVVLLFAMLTPGDQFPEVDYFSFQDKVIHAGCFGLLGFLWAGVKYHPFLGDKTSQILNFVFFGVLIGIGLEIAQMHIPFRTFDPWDMLANLIGGLLGFFTYLNFRRPK